MECTVLRSVKYAMTPECLPLKLTLCYENEEVVAKSKTTFPSRRIRSMRINKGTFHLKFRIEDVSKNHGRRRFSCHDSPKGCKL